VPSRATLLGGSIVYALVVFLGTAAIGFVVLPAVGYATGLFAIRAEAEGVFSLLTLKAVPFLVGLSAAAALSFEWLLGLSRFRRVVAYLATTLATWLAGAAVAAVILG